MERYELVEGSAAKFWEVSVTGDTVTVRFGRIGTNGQTKDKQLADAAAAEKEKQKLVKEKTGKGYALTGTGANAAPGAGAAGATTSTAAAKPKGPAKPDEAASGANPVTAAPTGPQRSAVDAAPSSDRASASTTPATTGATATAPEGVADETLPPADASAAFADESARHGLLFEGTPLPTRSRPAATIDAAADWAAYRQHMAFLPGEAKQRPAELRNIGERDQETPPTLTQDEMASLLRDVRIVWEYADANRIRQSPERPQARAGALAALARFGIATLGAPAMVDVMVRARAKATKQRTYQDLAWADPYALAMRDAFTAIPGDDAYDDALRAATALLGQDGDLNLFFVFVFADDRPRSGPLPMVQMLETAEGNGIDVPGAAPLLPLIADAPPSVAARWRAKRQYVFYFVYVYTTPETVAATLTAVARHHGESPIPALDWLLFYADDGARTTVARAILETREPDALTTLLPYFHEKWIRAAVDAATDAYPVWVFRQLLELAAGNRNEPAIKARLADLIARHGVATVRQWADGLGNKEIAALDRTLAARDVPAASDDALPEILRRAPWRKPAARAANQLATLSLTPIATPFAYAEGELEDNHQGARSDATITDLETLGNFVHEAEKTARNTWRPMPTPDTMPAAGELSGEQWVRWIERRLKAARAGNTNIYATRYSDLYNMMHAHHEMLSLALWEMPSVALSLYLDWDATVDRMFRRFGERVAPGFAELVATDPLRMLPLALPVDCADIAPHAARALTTLKKARVLAMPWLRRYRRTALLRLIPDAVGKAGPLRDAAGQTLRWIVDDAPDGRAALDEAVAAYAASEPRVVDAIAQVLAIDAADNVPSKPPKLPAWFQPAALTRPMLANGAGALSDDAMRGLGEMLMLGVVGEPYVGVMRTRAALTPDSAAAFAWDVFSVWMAEGAPSKENWAMRALGWLGDDECARNLTKLIRKWPGEAAHARAVTGLEVLADIGTDVALMNLNGIAEKLKFKGLQEKAREKIAAIAEARDLTPEELADRLAPDLGLDERGGLDLDFGERRFRVGFDEFLKPWVKDAEGRRLKDLPKPNKSDDEALSKEASATWSALKKDARAIASLQITRLESMLGNSRRVKPAVFQTFFAEHPLIRHLTQRLVWGVFPGDDVRATPTQVFRVTEDLSAADVNDDPVTLDLSADSTDRIGLVHPLHIDAETRAAWGTVFGDYEIAQPFLQLARETYTLDDSERDQPTITRFAEVEVETTRLRGMSTRGWNIGSPQDGGVSMWLERPVSYADGKSGVAHLHIEGGIWAGAHEYEPQTQKMGALGLDDPWGYQARKGKPVRGFGELDPITISELLRVPSLVAASGGA
jgi:predicted DNA-binding WGR domain protein